MILLINWFFLADLSNVLYDMIWYDAVMNRLNSLSTTFSGKEFQKSILNPRTLASGI